MSKETSRYLLFNIPAELKDIEMGSNQDIMKKILQHSYFYIT